MRRVAHLGCGPAHVPDVFFPAGEWAEIRVDINPDENPDLVASLVDLPMADGGVHAVFSAHTLEHLSPHDVPTALREMFRILAPGGFALVQVPDLQAAARAIADGEGADTAYEAPCGPVTPLDMVFGHAGMTAENPFMAHRCGFTVDTLHALMCAVGFSDVTVSAKNWAIDAVGVKHGNGA